MRLFTALFSLLFLAQIAQSQTFSIAGKAVDELEKPLDGAVVSLFRAGDSALVRTVLTEPDGLFEFALLKKGGYFLRATLLGFEPFSSEKAEISADLSGFLIKMQAKSTETAVVEVRAKTPFIERKIDRTVVNVEAQIGMAGATALEALEKSPGVLVDENGAIRLKGRAGVAVFINDKPTYLAGEQLANYLRSLPTGSIKSIELIPNPPARYDAAAGAGVINIVLKRDRNRGLFGSATLNYRQARFVRSNNAFNLNFNSARWSLFANVAPTTSTSYQDLNINRRYKNVDNTIASYFNQNSYIVKSNRGINGKIGADYYLTEKTTIGAVFTGLANPNFDQTDNVANVLSAEQVLLKKVLADNEEKGFFNNGGLNLNMRHQFDSLGQSLTVDADYVGYRSEARQTYLNDIFFANGELDFEDQLNGTLPSEISIRAAKFDYSKPLKKDSKIEAGAKTAFTKTDNAADYRDVKNGQSTPNFDLTNQFLYDEWINAVYLNFSKSFQRTDIQAGLRYENTILNGNQLGNTQKPGSTFDNDYGGFFPTFYMSRKLDSLGQRSVSFNYGRRIDRPPFGMLNPFISPLDKFTFYAGNPFLKPTFSHNLTLGYSGGGGAFSMNLNFSRQKNGINETLEIDSAGIYFSRPANLVTADIWSLDATLARPLTKKISINAYLEVGRTAFRSPLYTETLDASGFYSTGQTVFNFSMKKGWNAEVSGVFQTDYVVGQLVLKGFGVLNCAVSKKILKEKGTVKLAFGDLFHSRVGSGTINNLRATEADWNSKLDTRAVALTFSYRFGKATKGRQKHNSNGSESERARVRG